MKIHHNQQMPKQLTYNHREFATSELERELTINYSKSFGIIRLLCSCLANSFLRRKRWKRRHNFKAHYKIIKTTIQTESNYGKRRTSLLYSSVGLSVSLYLYGFETGDECRKKKVSDLFWSTLSHIHTRSSRRYHEDSLIKR